MLSSSRQLARLAVLSAGCALALPAPGVAAADGTGGANAPIPGTVSLSVAPAAMLGDTLAISGAGAGSGGQVTLQRLDPLQGWVTVARATARSDGRFEAGWRTDKIGRMSLRALPGDAPPATGSTTVPATAVTVYRPALATWYGPGFYGRRTACGVRLTRRVLGVAHPALPCGTKVDVLYRGRTLTVPVIDRGPFAHHATWDLTAATAHALGLQRTDRIGAVALRSPAARRARQSAG